MRLGRRHTGLGVPVPTKRPPITPCGEIGIRECGGMEYASGLNPDAERIEGSSPSAPTIYGPYLRGDGRKIVVIRENGVQRTTAYARYLMEQKLGRRLTSSETVDHIDNDKTNDSIENLQVLSRADNARKAMSLIPKQYITFKCPECGTEATKRMNYVRGNWKKGRKGPFCSRQCAGKTAHQ